MSRGTPKSSAEFGWSLSQRRALIVLLSVLLAGLAIRYACNPVYVSDPQPAQPARSNELASRLDPNTATWQELAAIPSLGEKRAKDMVAFRDRAHQTDPGMIVFRSPADLLRVKGIGKSTALNIQPYLIFPAAERPTTLRERE